MASPRNVVHKIDELSWEVPNIQFQRESDWNLQTKTEMILTEKLQPKTAIPLMKIALNDISDAWLGNCAAIVRFSFLYNCLRPTVFDTVETKIACAVHNKTQSQ